LVFEITESLLLPDDRRCPDEIDQLAGLGLSFSIDDFRTGYSFLAVLQKAPKGQLKIAKGCPRPGGEGGRGDTPARGFRAGPHDRFHGQGAGYEGGSGRG
jgi:hypothetical protein